MIMVCVIANSEQTPLDDHLRFTVTCSECGEKFTREQDVRRHYQAHAEHRDRGVYCVIVVVVQLLLCGWQVTVVVVVGVKVVLVVIGVKFTRQQDIR